MTKSFEIIDAYTHCGLEKFEPIEQVCRVMEKANVQRAVLVQHLGQFDNSYLKDIISANPDRFAGAFLVQHEAPHFAKELARWHRFGVFAGIRVSDSTCLSAPRLLHAAAELSLIIVLYAPNGVVRLAPWLKEFLRTHDQARLVITHMGNPDMADALGFQSYLPVFRLAEFKSVYFQISGMKMFCPYPHHPLENLVREAAKHFGPDRLMWGSNYPVAGDDTTYQSELRHLLDGKWPIPADAIPKVAGENARRLWFPKN